MQRADDRVQRAEVRVQRNLISEFGMRKELKAESKEFASEIAESVEKRIELKRILSQNYFL